jgi:hypothetical protein
MTNLNFGFLKNRFYISGFLSGLFVATIIAIILTAVYMPEPDTSKVKGTMASKECPRKQAKKPDCSECH